MTETKNPQLPPASLESLFYMLATSAMVNLGLVPNPVDQKTVRNLQAAQHSIDLLGVIREKTLGNLSPQELRLLDDILHDLRMKFVKATSPSEHNQEKGTTP
ncbi:MAG TPA: DUF1844 domain-containing protein [candidate division Zixibacteria bacterium]|jgi:hypothetical protein|nr:DUF1844 domain-containing protein [candidate division Zixibacteria bacterium]